MCWVKRNAIIEHVEIEGCTGNLFLDFKTDEVALFLIQGVLYMYSAACKEQHHL